MYCKICGFNMKKETVCTVCGSVTTNGDLIRSQNPFDENFSFKGYKECVKCKALLDETMAFCPNCGTNRKNEENTPSLEELLENDTEISMGRILKDGEDGRVQVDFSKYDLPGAGGSIHHEPPRIIGYKMLDPYREVEKYCLYCKECDLEFDDNGKNQTCISCGGMLKKSKKK